jgi:phospholipid/cholesterol/gamma-HCH transport system ATP-binding protein
MEAGDSINFIHQGQNWWQGGREDIFDSQNKELNEFVFASELCKKIRKITD